MHDGPIDLADLLAAGTSLAEIEALPGNILASFSIDASATAEATPSITVTGRLLSGILQICSKRSVTPRASISIADLLHPGDIRSCTFAQPWGRRGSSPI